jgi:hypothetical protein
MTTPKRSQIDSTRSLVLWAEWGHRAWSPILASAA